MWIFTAGLVSLLVLLFGWSGRRGEKKSTTRFFNVLSKESKVKNGKVNKDTT